MRHEMQQKMETMKLQERSGANDGADTRNLGRPVVFHGTDAAWRDWSVVTKSYSGLLNPELKAEMTIPERRTESVLNSRMLTESEIRANDDLFRCFLHITSGPALDRVINAGAGNGFRAWQSMVERWDRNIRSTSAGVPKELLQFDFPGDAEAFE